jgi:hypothetical protein
MSGDGHGYCNSKSLGAKLPCEWCYFNDSSFVLVLGHIYCPLTLVSMPISHPAMFTPASQTALACATKADTRIERTIVLQREEEGDALE